MDSVSFQPLDSYNLVLTSDGNDTAPTTFPIGVNNGTIDLLKPSFGGKGSQTRATYLAFLFSGTPAGTGTIVMTGAVDGGPEEFLCSLALTFDNGVVESGAFRWADKIEVTNFHIGAGGVKVEDSDNDHPCKIGFDATGYRFFRIYSTSLTTTTSVRVYARFF